jgi:uncharacterized protein
MTTPQQAPPTAAELRELLELEPHPTCGFTNLSYASQGVISKDALPPGYQEDHVFATALYFMVTPETDIRLHALRSDQVYSYHLGAALEVLCLYKDGSWAMHTVGPDIRAGQRPQLPIPGGTHHISRVKDGAEYSLLGTVEFPGFTEQDLVLSDATKLATEYPECAELIAEFTRR